MLRLKILVIKCNQLSELTLNSIRKNMPDWQFELVDYDGGFIRTALMNSDEICLVVRSGVILDIKEGDLPDRSLLEQYDICVSRDAVFSDNRVNKHVYGLLGSPLDKKSIDLSVFCINPKRWISIPETDTGVLGCVKRLRMPRHMNHKCDVIIPKAISAKVAMDYGMLGEQASVLNYASVYEKGVANGNEMFAYRLEAALDFLDGLPLDARQKTEAVALKTLHRAAKLRKGLAENLPLGVTK
jgi:hypothetical protein